MSERSSTLPADRNPAPWARSRDYTRSQSHAHASIDEPTSHLISSVSDVTERLLYEARLVAKTREQLGIQRRLADLAARFATATIESLDETMTGGLGEIADVLHADGAMLWRTAGNDSCAVASHTWCQDRTSAPDELTQLAFSPFIASKLASGDTVAFSRLDPLPAADRDALAQSGLQSAAVVSVAGPDDAAGVRTALAFGATESAHIWVPGIADQLRLVSGVFALALARKASLIALHAALDELRTLRKTGGDQAVQIRPTVKVLGNSRLVVSESPAVRQALAQVEQVAATPSTVLLLGETGVGKEVFAQAIHELSARHSRPMIRVSCAAIPSALIESELFGRERGAYTGALSRQIGRFEAAHQSTLFLDEIGELAPEVQVKLLRVLQDKVIERLGSTQQIKVDVRIIAATNRNLEKAVEDRVFREDLFYRLNVFPIEIPPLRERLEDIPALVWEFVNQYSKSIGKRIESISKDSMKQLQLHSWPGNVRELRNVIERAVIVANGPHLTIPVPQPSASRQPKASMTLRNLEIEHIRATLERTNWRIRGPLGAAERLGLKPTTLETRMAKLGLTRPKGV